MRNAACWVFSILFCSTVVVGVVLLTGCETSKGTSGLDVSPSAVTLTDSTNSVTFEVTNVGTNTLALPLDWVVANASLGAISGASGTKATYVRSAANGVNTITVYDQYDNEGYAIVTQTDDPDDDDGDDGGTNGNIIAVGGI